MPHVRQAPLVDVSGVEEVEAADLVPVWRVGLRADFDDDEAAAQLVEAQLGRRDAVQVRYFATRVDGQPASYCELFSDGETGQIESVMTGVVPRSEATYAATITRSLLERRFFHGGIAPPLAPSVITR